MHVLLECPRYTCVRQRFANLLSPATQGAAIHMCDLMCHDNQASVAHFAHSVLRMHARPIVSAGVSNDDVSLRAESDELELVEMSSGEVVLQSLLHD